MSGSKTTTSNTVTPWIPDQSTFDSFKSRAQGLASPEYTAAMGAANAGYDAASAAYAGMNPATDPRLRAQMGQLGESGISGRFTDVTSREAGVLPQFAGMAGQSAGVDGGVMDALRRAMDPNSQSQAFDQVRQNTINSIMPSINSSFAGSGMTGSSLHAQNLSKGLGAGIADIEDRSYQRGADRALNAGNSLQSILSGDFAQRLGSAQAVQGASSQAYRDNLSAAQAQQNATFTDRGQQLNAVNSMADFDSQEFARQMGLTGAQAGITGAQYDLASDQQATNNNALMGLLSSATGAASRTQTTQKKPGLFGILGAGAQIAGMFSDERLKEDIKRVGAMDDGTPIYTYRYKQGVPDPTGGKVHMGVMAQDILETVPDAVGEADGFLTVDYGVLQ